MIEIWKSNIRMLLARSRHVTFRHAEKFCSEFVTYRTLPFDLVQVSCKDVKQKRLSGSAGKCLGSYPKLRHEETRR